MTVYELIRELSKYPADSEVKPEIEGARKSRKLVCATRVAEPPSWHGIEVDNNPVLLMILNDDGGDS